jgi:hypothetical protein
MALRGLPREGIPPEVVAGVCVTLCLVYCFQRIFCDISLHSLLELTSICLSLAGLKVCTTTPRSKILGKLLKGGNWRLLSVISALRRLRQEDCHRYSA